MNDTGMFGNKVQKSSDPIDRYVMEHSLRLTSEQNEIVEYTCALPGYYSPLSYIINRIDLFYRKFTQIAWFS
jgi:hypothetical protein